jgi:hypothetical protein
VAWLRVEIWCNGRWGAIETSPNVTIGPLSSQEIYCEGLRGDAIIKSLSHLERIPPAMLQVNGRVVSDVRCVNFERNHLEGAMIEFTNVDREFVTKHH